MSLIKIAEEEKLELRVQQAVLEFDCFFQEHMWNGYDDEDDPKFLSPKDFDAIQALSDKIQWMICEIGSPSSVLPMLHSIADRKIKTWVATGEFRGKQLKSKGDKAKAHQSYRYVRDKHNMTITGHFRWNWTAYTLSRTATDLLQKYIINSLI